MKYSVKYPNACIDDEPEESVVLFNIEGPCWNCGEMTPWMDICFEAHICSEECNKIKTREFFNAASC